MDKVSDSTLPSTQDSSIDLFDDAESVEEIPCCEKSVETGSTSHHAVQSRLEENLGVGTSVNCSSCGTQNRTNLNQVGSEGYHCVDQDSVFVVSDNEENQSPCHVISSDNDSKMENEHFTPGNSPLFFNCDTNQPNIENTNFEVKHANTTATLLSNHRYVEYAMGEEQVEANSSNDQALTCPFCNVNETSLYRLEFHIATSHVDSDVHGVSPDVAVSNSTYDLPSASGTDLFSCPLCDLGVPSEAAIEDHLRAVHAEIMDDGTTLSCPLCEFICGKETDLRQHIQSHSGDRTFYGVSSSDEVPGPTDSKACPVCGWLFEDTDLLTSHVETHFSSPQAKGVQARRSTSNSDSSDHSVNQGKVNTQNSKGKSSSKGKGRSKGVYDRQYEQNLERAVLRGEVSVADFHEQQSRPAHRGLRDVDSGETRVPGLIEKVQHLFHSQARSGQSVHLCAPTDHFSGSYGDKGWGCGYRNFQMLLSCLLRNSNYAYQIFPDGSKDVPSVKKIQEMIESAWHKGFDPQGCQQLNGRLANTRKWIGATEIVALLSSLKVKCHLADFHAPSAPDGTHPRLLEWINNYFCDQRGFKPPVYLQHQGHSRTVVGVEKEKGVIKLLLFDPGTSMDQMASIAGSPLTWKQMKTFRRTQAGFRSRQYQVVAVTGLLTEQEYLASKILKSERVS